MKSLWNDQEAAEFTNDDLSMRVYTSRLLGADENLVMHGGGNTSVKSTAQDFFGRNVEVLYVKGSGWDLGTIEKPGFAPLRLEETKLLAERATLSDTDMAKQLRAVMLDQSAPSPSVEAILHAIMPFKYVDHTHTDSVVTLTNNPNGEAIIKELYPDCLILPYIMPGFILSKQVYDALLASDINNYKGIILMHHGVFTYSDDARVAYEDMIELVDRADQYIAEKADSSIPAAGSAPDLTTGNRSDLVHLAKIRRAVSHARGAAQLAILNSTPSAAAFASRDDVADISNRGPITPDHVIRTKRIAAICEPTSSDNIPEIQAFADAYKTYYATHDDGTLTMLDPSPRWGVWKNNGTLSFGSTIKECDIITDIIRHTAWAIQVGESLGGWEALPAHDIFELEYWILEQAKLNKPGGAVKPHLGKVAIVTGAAGGIGAATAKQLHADGAVVVGLDINPSVSEKLNAPGLSGVPCDLTDEAALKDAIDNVVAQYGGLDIVVANAGIFKSGEYIEQLSDSWDRHIDINLTATQRLFKHTIPYLKLGIDASIVVIGSRNYTAPGAGAAAYSVSKAGVTQLARVAALELAPHGVRVNTLHPDAVFDTDLWTDEALERSAARYGITIQEYKTKNLLGTEITSADVANLVSTVASSTFSATTGAQIPIDGGNDRVI
jgi:rhamnose utilization protein RhaD (predicted bifunctional aldolase and dehydrogenase)/NAD(P)-dependent dehydrogenase (short-subunit alcohol dehydrogenase family)